MIANFNLVESRQDIGALWENFLVSERLKLLHYSGKWTNYWYWRTKSQKEIDYIEEYDGNLCAYEFKWNPKATIKPPSLFMNNYKNSSFQVVHRDNYDTFLLNETRVTEGGSPPAH